MEDHQIQGRRHRVGGTIDRDDHVGVGEVAMSVERDREPDDRRGRAVARSDIRIAQSAVTVGCRDRSDDKRQEQHGSRKRGRHAGAQSRPMNE
jgi:hypothetical protein